MAAINATLSRRFTPDQISSLVSRSKQSSQDILNNWKAIDPITESVKKARAEQLHMLESYAETLHGLIAEGRKAIASGRVIIQKLQEDIDTLKADGEFQHQDALHSMERNLFSAKTALLQQTRMVSGVSNEYASVLGRAASMRLEIED